MGSGSWSSSTFASYSTSKGRSVDASTGTIKGDFSAQSMFSRRKIAEELNPYKVIRECRDTAEHPNTVPVILALDVTGSMGNGAVKVAKQLNVIMTELFQKVKDVEFLIMAIGDLAYDDAPVQASQYESDIRIAEHLDKVYFEGGGGGNLFESYTAAWYFGLHHTDLDCWKRGKKGIIITLGDEPLNPYLPKKELNEVTGDTVQSDIQTKDLFNDTSKKFSIYHLAVNDTSTQYRRTKDYVAITFGEYLDEEHFRVVTLDSLTQEIVDIVVKEVSAETDSAAMADENVAGETLSNGYISWD